MKSFYAVPFQMVDAQKLGVIYEYLRKDVTSTVVLRSIENIDIGSFRPKTSKVSVYNVYVNRGRTGLGWRRHHPLSLSWDDTTRQLVLVTIMSLREHEDAEHLTMGAEVTIQDEDGQEQTQQTVFSFGVRLTPLRMVEEHEK